MPGISEDFGYNLQWTSANTFFPFNQEINVAVDELITLDILLPAEFTVD